MSNFPSAAGSRLASETPMPTRKGRAHKPSDLAEPALNEALLDSVAKTGTSKEATRRSRTGDLLLTKPEQGETENNQDEPSPQKTEDSD